MKAKYNLMMAELFREAFCWLPLAHVLNQRVLVVHGGLFSNDNVSLDDIRTIDRYRCGPCMAVVSCNLATVPSPTSRVCSSSLTILQMTNLCASGLGMTDG